MSLKFHKFSFISYFSVWQATLKRFCFSKCFFFWQNAWKPVEDQFDSQHKICTVFPIVIYMSISSEINSLTSVSSSLKIKCRRVKQRGNLKLHLMQDHLSWVLQWYLTSCWCRWNLQMGDGVLRRWCGKEVALPPKTEQGNKSLIAAAAFWYNLGWYTKGCGFKPSNKWSY